MKVLLGVTGGIAAYKSAELLRLLQESGFDVRVVMTKSAQAFVTPLTFQALSGHTVYTDLFASSHESAMDHIQLARWADLILIAPASANFLARLTHGNADDLLTTLCLATEAPIAIAPAMNQQMWANPVTQTNVGLLKERGILCFGPGVGEQACGEVGPGRLLEPFELVDLLREQFRIPALEGKRILITAGPTRESIDPIRYLTNRSTGMMGYALAEAASIAGAKVMLVSGPTHLCASKSIQTMRVNSALEMHEVVMSHISSTDIFIAAAAVSDYRAKSISDKKIKKSDDEFVVRLVRNPDILAEVTKLDTPPFTVGFAAETESLLHNAQKKLEEKHLDMIIANRVGESRGFGDSETSVTVLKRTDEKQELPIQKKSDLARCLIRLIAEQYRCKKTRLNASLS